MKIVLRNIRKHKAYSFITIIGLAIGIAVCILIFLFVEYELGFDSHAADKEHIYRVVTQENRAEGRRYTGGTPFPTAAALRSDFPEMERTTQIYRDSDVMITVGENRFRGDIVFFVESQFFELFDTEWIQGSVSQALDDPFTVILTERLADKYFVNEEAVGKVLQLDNEYDLRVAGVVANPPRSTSLPYDMLISWKTLNARWDAGRLGQWDLLDTDSHTFTLLPGSVEAKNLEKRFEQFEQKYMEPDYAKSWSFRLQPLGDIHIKSLYETESKLIIMIQSASFLSILIACLGLLGLVSFMVLQRSKEIGIRKVLGATVMSVYFMVSKDFFKWVVIANIVAWPLAYYLTHEWLQEFAYRIPLGVGYFLIGGSISLGLAALVMSYQVVRAATADPVESLRYE